MSKSLRPSAASTKSRSLAATPAIVATVAKLIAQVQDATEAATLAAFMSADDGLLVLQPPAEQSRHSFHTAKTTSIFDDAGYSLDGRRYHVHPEEWKRHAHMDGFWHPARWYFSEHRVDSNGVRWSRPDWKMVCDDFGNLVEISA